MAMKLYLLERKDTKFDLFISLVVRAKSAGYARRIARKFAAEHGEDSEYDSWAQHWSDPEYTTIKQIKIEGPSEVVHTDFLNP